MSRVFVGSISSEGEYLLRSYLDNFMPEAVIEPLKPLGIKGKMRLQASRPDVVLVVIDEELYQSCVGVVDDVLAMEKVHKYTDDDSLKQFLIRWFGRLDGVSDMPTAPKHEDDLGGESLYIASMDSHDESEKIISDLKDKLAQSELLVSNLTMQLNDSKGDSDISAFVKRIKELETALNEKDAELQNTSVSGINASESSKKLEQALAEIETLKSELRTAKEDCSALEFEKRNLEKAKSSSETQLTSALSELEELKETQTKLEEVQSALKEMTEECASLKASSADVGVLQEKLRDASEISNKLEEARNLLTEKELEVKNLTVDVQTKTARCDKLSGEIGELNEMLAEKESELDAKIAEFNTLQDEHNDLLATSEKLQLEISKLNSTIDSLNRTLEEKTARVIELEQEKTDSATAYSEKLSALQEDSKRLGDKDSEISELTSALDRCKSTINSLNVTVEELKTSISIKEGEVDAYKRREELLQASIEKANNSISRMTDERRDLDSRYSELSSARNALERELSSLRVECDTYKTQLATQSTEKDLAYEELANEKKKLENEVLTLRESLVDAKTDSSTIQELNEDLLAEKRKVARLNSELEVLRSSSDLLGSQDNEEELARLRSELEEARRGISQAGISSDEINMLKEKVANLELDLMEKTETLDELENGIFGQLANIALPRLAYDIKLITPERLTSKFVCIASGSLESNIALYQNLKKTCASSPNTKYLIVDLVTDTSIDLAFGIKSISTPIKWLTGTEPYTNFVADTASPNVKVMSTGLAYINDLSLVMVDWEKRLRELEGQADVVILNVGCLNNLVSKILYASFSAIMLSHIIVKATPFNLRTLILILTGFKSLKNTMVSCVNFDSISKPLYQKLTQKCQSQILKDGDMIRL